MDRQITYPGQLLTESSLLQATKDAMIGCAKVSSAVLGTNTIANGFAVTPTGPASLQVLCAPGEIYSMTAIDSAVFSSLPADTTHSILKQGILLDGITLSCPAPGTTGQSINYLIQATYQDSDLVPVLLPYYNSANPALPYSGMGNNGLPQNTIRKGVAVVAVKAGASATTGSQVTPAPDSGYVGLYVVTVAYGQTTITSTSISQYIGAPLMLSGIVPAMQSSAFTYTKDFGTAGVYKVNYSPAITQLTDGMTLEMEVKTTNIGGANFSPNGIGPNSILGAAHSALQGGELAAGGKAVLMWHATLSSWVLLSCTGGPTQVAPATQLQHAVQFGQLTSVVGSARNLQINIVSASATATVTADEIVVESYLGGASYKISNFSKNINLATTGAGGMDTGSPPANGYVAIYAIYNPTSGTSALLAVNTTASRAPEIYGGANIPAGYTAAALVSIWRVATSLLVSGTQYDRLVAFQQLQAVSTSTIYASGSTISISGVTPINAKTISGSVVAQNSASSVMQCLVSGSAIRTGEQGISVTATSQTSSSISGVPLSAPQTIGILTSSTAGTPVFFVFVSAYTF